MALPNPLPDNPMRWDGWRKYNSTNVYERLCLDFASNASNDVIEDNCRQLLVWWQKKLPLKNQPSNPMAQLLRQGLDEAPAFLAEARTILLDPEQRKVVDAELHAEVVASALEEFKKLLTFALAGSTLSKESEDNLFTAGERMGLRREEIVSVIEAELASTGSKRVVEEPPAPAPPAPAHPTSAQAAAAPTQAAVENDPHTEFRKILRMSRLCLDGEEMSDDQRDAMCNLGESLGLTGGEAEDLIDEYLEEAAAMPGPPPVATIPRSSVNVAGTRVATAPPKPVPARPAPTRTAVAPSPVTAAPVGRKDAEINVSPAARMAERQRFPNFVNFVGGEMLLIPSGQFMMGTNRPDAGPNEQPANSRSAPFTLRASPSRTCSTRNSIRLTAANGQRGRTINTR
jgi:hypothetical protein